MENHPIPQNVTGFQFKLIGDMTLKQFAYLAAGCVIAGIFLFVANFNFILIRLPIISISLGMGVGLAFIPIMGRPMDIILTNFAHALLTPNQYTYQKAGGILYVPVFVKRAAPTRRVITSSHTTKDLQTFLNRLPQKPKNALDEKEATFMKSLFISQGTPSLKKSATAIKTTPQVQQPQVVSVAHIAPTSAGPQQNNPVSQSQPIVIAVPQKNVDILEKKAESLEKELEQAKHIEAVQTGGISLEGAHRKVLELEKQLQEALVQKQQVEMQFNEFIKIVGNQMATNTLPIQNTVRTVPNTGTKKQEFPMMPEVPNLITGMIKDSRGNILPNILVEVKDKEENPIRAFKTNNLGQFASATPLLNGVYTLVFEDPDSKHKFDNLEITIRGEIIQPIQITSIDAREELRKELFG